MGCETLPTVGTGPPLRSWAMGAEVVPHLLSHTRGATLLFTRGASLAYNQVAPAPALLARPSGSLTSLLPDRPNATALLPSPPPACADDLAKCLPALSTRGVIFLPLWPLQGVFFSGRWGVRVPTTDPLF